MRTSASQPFGVLLIFNLLAFAMVTGGLPAALAQGMGTPRAVVVLDSSRSMWGQIDGQNKVVIARDALEQTFASYAGKVELGVVAYGHRQSSGCSDIETLASVGPIDVNGYTAKIDAIKPKGATPIASALEHAAGDLGDPGHPGTIVLLSDGPDNCHADPCATAAKLKQSHAALTVDVIGFDRNNQDDVARLACVAKATGGTYYAATSKSELGDALGDVFKAIAKRAQPLTMAENDDGVESDAGGGANATGAADADDAADDDQTPQEPARPVPVTFNATLTERGTPVDAGLTWRIFDPRPDAKGSYKLLSTHREANPTAALMPGRYLVNVAYGLAYVTKTVNVEPGKTNDETFVLNAGGLRLSAAQASGEPIPPQAVHYDIFSDETDQFGNREKILGDVKPDLIIRLNAGVYHVVSTYGDANAVVRADVTVEPGKLTEATINQRAARVTFKLVMQPGGEALPETSWSVLTPSGDVVKESAGALPSHILAAGRYTVLARHDGKNYSREFTVEPGRETRVEVVVR